MTAQLTRTVVHFTDATAFGGAERILLILLSGLDRKLWTPVLFHSGDPGILPFVDQVRSLNIRTLAVPPITDWWDLPAAARFIRRLRAQRASVFHAHLAWPLRCRYELALALLIGTPGVVATQQLYHRSEVRERASARWQQRLCHRLHRYILVSDAMARDVQKTCRGSIPGMQVIHNAVPVADYIRAPDPELRRALAPAGQPLVLSVARLDPQKGLVDLLTAATLLPEAKFVVAGTGPERDALLARHTELRLGDRFQFLGHRDDIPELLAICDVFVLPSHYEGLPVSVIEAMAAGKPVVATTVGGNEEIVVHEKTGLLVPRREPQVLAAAIQLILSDPALARRLGEAARVRAQREFSAEVMVQRISEAYASLFHPAPAACNDE
jgi:glycosyltransferase involved in cell wall biosynthesis